MNQFFVIVASLLFAGVVGFRPMIAPLVSGRDRVVRHNQDPMGKAITDAFFGADKDDYPELGMVSGYTGDKHNGILDAWSTSLTDAQKKALARQINKGFKP